MRARSASEMCGASSIPIVVTERSGEGFSVKRRTTSDMPKSGVKVRKTRPPVAVVRVRPSE